MTTQIGIPEYWHDYILAHAFTFTLKQFSESSGLSIRNIKKVIHEHRIELGISDVYWKEFILRNRMNYSIPDLSSFLSVSQSDVVRFLKQMKIENSTIESKPLPEMPSSKKILANWLASNSQYYTVQEISELTSISKRTILYKLKALGLPHITRRPSAKSIEKDSEIEKFFIRGLNDRQIGENFGVSRQAIEQARKRLGLKK